MFPCSSGVDTGVKLALPQTPCCRACTSAADQGETWIRVYGVCSRVLNLAVLRSLIPQGEAGGSDARAGHHRGNATLDVCGMTSVLQLAAARSQFVSGRAARSS